MIEVNRIPSTGERKTAGRRKGRLPVGQWPAV